MDADAGKNSRKNDPVWELPQTQCCNGVKFHVCWDAYSVEASAMIYDDNHNPETGGSKEIFGTWIFTIGLIGLVMLVLGIFN